MSVASRILERLARLPPAFTRDVGVDRSATARMPDGAVLVATRLFPRDDPSAPTVLMRTPYGRGRFEILGRLFAERGYQAIVQSVRGTFGSAGTFHPFRNEAADGRATLEWIRAQPWCNGQIAMFGPSYLGFSQWAAAGAASRLVQALAIQVASSDRRASLYPGGAFFFDFALRWLFQLHHQERPVLSRLIAKIFSERTLTRAFDAVPVDNADTSALGAPSKVFQDWLSHPPDSEFWNDIDASRHLHEITAPVSLTAGLYDYNLAAQLADHRALKNAGHSPQLTLGPWKHLELAPTFVGLREALAWFDVHLKNDASKRREKSVRAFVIGIGEWREMDEWPPVSSPLALHLREDHGLCATAASASDPDPSLPT